MKAKTMLVGAVLLSTIALAGENQAPDYLRAALTRMRSETIEERQAAARDILQARQQTVTSVESIVREYIADEGRKGTTTTAIGLLGQLRGVESVPLLVEHLTFGVFYRETKRPQPPEDYFPCVGALIQIGMPSLEAVLDRAAASDDTDVHRCAAYVVQGVLGKKLADTYLADRIAGEKDPAAARRLEAVRASLGE